MPSQMRPNQTIPFQIITTGMERFTRIYVSRYHRPTLRFNQLWPLSSSSWSLSSMSSMLSFQGLFSRITFSQPVYLGGKGAIRNVKHFLQMDQGVGFPNCPSSSLWPWWWNWLWHCCHDDVFHFETITKFAIEISARLKSIYKLTQ